MPFSLLRAPIKRPDIVLLNDSLSAVEPNTDQQILACFTEAL